MEKSKLLGFWIVGVLRYDFILVGGRDFFSRKVGILLLFILGGGFLFREVRSS